MFSHTCMVLQNAVEGHGWRLQAEGVHFRLCCAVLCCEQASVPVVGGPCFPWLFLGPATAGLHSLLCRLACVAAFCPTMRWGALTICVLGLPGQNTTPLRNPAGGHSGHPCRFALCSAQSPKACASGRPTLLVCSLVLENTPPWHLVLTGVLTVCLVSARCLAMGNSSSSWVGRACITQHAPSTACSGVCMAALIRPVDSLVQPQS
jgi:hypothetical protein